MEWYLIKEPAIETENAKCVFKADNKPDILAAQGMFLAQDKSHKYTIGNSENTTIVSSDWQGE